MVALVLLLVGCLGEPTPRMLPAHYSSDVDVEIGGLIDIDSKLHAQLWVEDEEVVGWVYHTGGMWEVQGVYYEPPCDPEWVSGEYRARSWGYHIPCLKLGNSCLETKVRFDTVQIDLGGISYGMLGPTEIERESDLQDTGMENFECIK